MPSLWSCYLPAVSLEPATFRSLAARFHNITRQPDSLEASLVERYRHTAKGDQVHSMNFFTYYKFTDTGNRPRRLVGTSHSTTELYHIIIISTLWSRGRPMSCGTPLSRTTHLSHGTSMSHGTPYGCTPFTHAACLKKCRSRSVTDSSPRTYLSESDLRNISYFLCLPVSCV